jgi:hypothetical protein
LADSSLSLILDCSVVCNEFSSSFTLFAQLTSLYLAIYTLKIILVRFREMRFGTHRAPPNQDPPRRSKMWEWGRPCRTRPGPSEHTLIPNPHAPILAQRAVTAAKSGWRSAQKWPLNGAAHSVILATTGDDGTCVISAARALAGQSIWTDILLRIADHGHGSVNTVAVGFQESTI